MEKSANIIIGTLAVIGVALGIASVHLLQAVDSEHEAALAEATKREQAEATIKDLQARYDTLQTSYLELREHPAPMGIPAKVATAAPVVQPLRPERNYAGFGNGQTIGTRQSIYVPPNDGRGRPMGPRQVGNIGIIKSLKLSEGDEGKLLKLLTEDQDKFREALAASDGKPLDQQVVDAMRNEADQRVRDLLGEEKFREYEDNRKYQAEHEQITRLNMRLANTVEGGALSDVQESQLFNVLKEEKARIPAPTYSQFATQPEFSAALEQWRDAYLARTQTRAATILTPEQLNVFKNPPNPLFRGPARRN